MKKEWKAASKKLAGAFQQMGSASKKAVKNIKNVKPQINIELMSRPPEEGEMLKKTTGDIYKVLKVLNTRKNNSDRSVIKYYNINEMKIETKRVLILSDNFNTLESI